MSRSARHLSDDLDPPLRRRPRRSWRQRVVLTVLCSIVVVCLAGASVGGYVLAKYISIDRVDDLDLGAAAKGEPENFLIVGIDPREGQTSKNTDTIMVARVDPGSDRLALTSFPRDLMVTIADTGEFGMINSAYNRPNDGQGEQNLIDTLNQNFGIPINHFIEVNFESFKEVVDAVGGVSVWLPSAVRDLGSGLYSEEYGCVQLDGQEALDFVRARKLQVMTSDGWEHDPLSDEHRVQRQQVFIQRALTKALAQVKSNPLRVTELVNIGIETVRFDNNLGVREMIDLGEHFSDFSSDELETYVLPVLPYPQNTNRLLLDDKEAQPVLNVFRGLPPGELSPLQASVQVINATGKDGFARDISGALQKVGFDMQEPDSSDERPATTTVQHAPGQAKYGQLVASYLTAPATLAENPELADGEVVVVVGADFTTVHSEPAPVETTTTSTTTVATVAGEQAAATATAGGSTTTTSTGPPTTTTTEGDPFIIGEPPPGASCD